MICFDTAPVIWGVQGAARPSQIEMIERTRRYIHHLDRTGQRVMIPAPVLVEYLLGFLGEEQDRQSGILEQSFLIPALDIPASRLAARLQSNTSLLQTIRTEHGVDRQGLRIEAMIIAIAVVNRAERIVTGDPHFRQLAQSHIEVVEVPVIPNQAELFDSSQPS
jgi:predicted nucleic acid-binding protein